MYWWISTKQSSPSWQQRPVRFHFLGLTNILSSHRTFPAHYARYFKQTENAEPGDTEITFDWNELRDVCKSFLDSIIIELCFPQAPYPKSVLYQILHDAVEESPREAKRFPQSLWDSIGDLSVSLPILWLVEYGAIYSIHDRISCPRRIRWNYKNYLRGHYSERNGKAFRARCPWNTSTGLTRKLILKGHPWYIPTTKILFIPWKDPKIPLF